MQVGRPIDDGFRRFRDSRVAIAPVANLLGASYPKASAKMLSVGEIRLDVIEYCGICGIPVCQNTAKTVSKRLCQGCRRSELQRQGSLENIRPASPMAGPVKRDGRVCTAEAEVESEPETFEPLGVSAEHFHSSFRVKNTSEDAGSFRSMEVLTCFRSQVRRGLRLLLKAATAEKWHVCWAILLSMFVLPMILTLMVAASVGFLVLSTWVAIAAVVVYPLAYINPILYNYATDS